MTMTLTRKARPRPSCLQHLLRCLLCANHLCVSTHGISTNSTRWGLSPCHLQVSRAPGLAGACWSLDRGRAEILLSHLEHDGGKGQLDMTCPPEMHNLMCVAKSFKKQLGYSARGDAQGCGSPAWRPGKIPGGCDAEAFPRQTRMGNGSLGSKKGMGKCPGIFLAYVVHNW